MASALPENFSNQQPVSSFMPQALPDTERLAKLSDQKKLYFLIFVIRFSYDKYHPETAALF